MISIRQKVFDFMEENPNASNKDIYEKFEAEKQKEKDTVRRYRNQFLREEEEKKNFSGSGINRDIPTIPGISQGVSQPKKETSKEPIKQNILKNHIPEVSQVSHRGIPDIPRKIPKSYPVLLADLIFAIRTTLSAYRKETNPEAIARKARLNALLKKYENEMEDLLERL